MKKIKVLQFPVGNAYGGITQYALQNWQLIDKSRFQFDFATLSKDPLFFEQQVISQGCKVFHISCYAEENEQQFGTEMKGILSKGYDAVHLHTSYWKSFKVEELAKEAGIPKIIIHAHNSNVLGEKCRQEMIERHQQCVEHLSEKTATDFWACSKMAAKWLYGDRIPEERIVIQKNAIDLDRFAYNSSIADRIKAELGWEDNFVIGHVGRFTYQKNQAFLFRVFREAFKQNTNLRLLMIGIGPDQTNIREAIASADLQDVVLILEKRNDVHELMQAMDCFAMPSRFEGLPIVLIEAQAAGCHCIASDLISEEAALTEGFERLPLIEEVWVQKVLEMSRIRRGNLPINAKILREKGYDLHDQIKKIEEGYVQGIGSYSDL